MIRNSLSLGVLSFCGSVFLFAVGCSERKTEAIGSTANESIDVEAQAISEEEVVISAKRYMRIYFRRIEQVYGTSLEEEEEGYFSDGVFKPYAEFDDGLQRWAVSFSNGLGSIVIEMNADATLGGLVTSAVDIPKILRDRTTDSNMPARVRLVDTVEFREAVESEITLAQQEANKPDMATPNQPPD